MNRPFNHIAGALPHDSPRLPEGANAPQSLNLSRIGPGTVTAVVATRPEGRAAPNLSTFTEDCSECEGTGWFYCGERTWDCESCSGTGEVEIEPTCQCGETADANGFCAACDDVAETGWLLSELSAVRCAIGMAK